MISLPGSLITVFQAGCKADLWLLEIFSVVFTGLQMTPSQSLQVQVGAVLLILSQVLLPSCHPVSVGECGHVDHLPQHQLASPWSLPSPSVPAVQNSAKLNNMVQNRTMQ